MMIEAAVAIIAVKLNQNIKTLQSRLNKVDHQLESPREQETRKTTCQTPSPSSPSHSD